jgi:Predicted Fe-S-cluster redox enzyme
MMNLLNLTLPELEAWMQTELGEPKFRALQVWQWIWQRMARDFEAMTNISKACRQRLAAEAEIIWPEVVTVEKSTDDTTKFLLRLEDGALVETVLIPSDSREGVRRWTQCLSSQVGCAMACTFCSTGQMGFERNMTMGEILGQILVAREHLGDDRPDWPMLRNVVFMGMGEPLLNMRELMRSLENLNNDKGLNFSPRRITVSTCGIEKGLRELGESGLAYLAVSLHEGKGNAEQRFHGLVQGNDDGRGVQKNANDAVAYAQQGGRHTDAHFHILPAAGLTKSKERITHAVQPKASGYAQHNQPQLRRIVLPARHKP